MTWTIVIRGGVVLDGTGSDAVRGDLAIRDGEVVSIPPISAGTARRTIDARGLVVAPGFIVTCSGAPGKVGAHLPIGGDAA